MSDLIDRQAAIDTINNILAEYSPVMFFWQEGIPLECAAALANIPAAQPEIIRCKECKWWNQRMCHSTAVPDARLCDCMNVYTDPDQFCKYGERREDG